MYDPPLRVYLHPLSRVMAGFLRNSLPRISINAPPPPSILFAPRYICFCCYWLVCLFDRKGGVKKLKSEGSGF